MNIEVTTNNKKPKQKTPNLPKFQEKILEKTHLIGKQSKLSIQYCINYDRVENNIEQCNQKI